MNKVERNRQQARKRIERTNFAKDTKNGGRNILANFVERVVRQEAAKSPLLRTVDRSKEPSK